MLPSPSPRSNPVKSVRFLSVEPYTRIKSLSAVVRHFGDPGRAGTDTSRFTRSTLPRVLLCANPRCCDGGYDLSPLLRDLLDRHASDARTVLPCCGSDGLPLGRGSSQSSRCMNSIEIEVRLEYRPDDLEASPASGSNEPKFALES